MYPDNFFINENIFNTFSIFQLKAETVKIIIKKTLSEVVITVTSIYLKVFFCYKASNFEDSKILLLKLDCLLSSALGIIFT